MKDRIIASILCGAIGDSLGMPFEGWSRDRIIKRLGRVENFLEPVVLYDEFGVLLNKDEFGELKYWTRDLSRGDITDDTILSLSLVESIADKSGVDIDDIAQKHIEVYEASLAGDHPYIKGGFGGTTIEAIKKLIAGAKPKDSGVYGIGTGPAMKMAPLGLFSAILNKDFSFTIDNARRIGEITHKDPRAVICGILQAIAVVMALDNQDLEPEDFIAAMVAFCEENESRDLSHCRFLKDGHILERLQWIQSNLDEDMAAAHGRLGSNSRSTSAYPFTLFATCKYWDSPLEGMIDLVNWGGDCDTTASMFGNIMGARHGMFAKPEWLESLNQKDMILQKVNLFIESTENL